MRGFSRYTPGVRLIAATVIVFFAWSTLEMHELVLLAQTTETSTSAGDAAFQAMDDAVVALEGAIEAIDTALAAGGNAASAVSALDGPAGAIDAADAGVRGALSAIESHLRDRGAPPEALQRHAEFIASYESGLRAVRDHVAAVRESPAGDLKTRVDRAKGHLKERRGRPHTPLNPADLPRRQAPPKDRAPRLRPDEFADPLRVASAGSPFELLAASEVQADDPSAYLGETTDAPFSQGIRDLATSLGGSPVAIYNWVRQNVAFVPTYGSIQGAEACRVSRECNAFDTASLLVALLRVSGVPARYVIGTIETPPALFRRAMGDFPDVAGAARLASSGGIPVTVVHDGTGGTVAVRMEHVWIEAHVDYVPSRGVARGAGDTWVPLDAALKPARFQAPITAGAAGIDPVAIVDRLLAAGTPGNGGNSLTGIPAANLNGEATAAIAALESYLDTQKPDATVGEVLGAIETIAPPVRALPASLPGRVLVAGARLATLPAASRHVLTLSITDQFGFSESLRVQRSTVELAGRRFTISFIPAMAADAATIESFGGKYLTPAYLVNVRPVVYLDGAPVTSGTPVRMGTLQRVSVGFREPDGSTDSVEHQVTAGTYAAVGLDLQRVSREEVDARRQRMNAVAADMGVRDLNVDDVIGETLHINSLTYFLQVDGTNRIAANALNVVALKRPAEMLATLAPSFRFVFGTATTVQRMGMNVDVRRYIVSVSSRQGSRQREIDYMFASGTQASAAEHAVFEHPQGGHAVSAVQLIGEANARGIPVYAINATNAGTLIPQLHVSSAVLNDVRNAIAAGKDVLIPRDEMTYFQWRGTGYIVVDPDTGAAGYMISGGLAGGGTADGTDWLEILQNILTAISTLIDELVEVGAALRWLAKAVPFASKLGPWLTGISAILSAYSMYRDTGSVWKALGAGLADLALSILSGLMIGVAVGLALGPLNTFIMILAVATFFFLIGSLIADAIQNAGLLDRMRQWLARARQRLKDPSGGPSGFDGLNGLAWGIA